MERFIKEYANYKIKNCADRVPMEYRQAYEDLIGRAVRYREMGRITIDEAIQTIVDAEYNAMK